MRLYPSSVLGTMTSVGAVSVVHFFLSLVSSIIFFVMADMVRQRGKKKKKKSHAPIRTVIDGIWEKSGGKCMR